MKLYENRHKKHPMPKNPTVDQRIECHTEHAKKCKCRDISEN